MNDENVIICQVVDFEKGNPKAGNREKRLLLGEIKNPASKEAGKNNGGNRTTEMHGRGYGSAGRLQGLAYVLPLNYVRF